MRVREAILGYRQPLRSSGVDHDDLVLDYKRDGYAIVRGLFTPSEIAAIAAAADQLYSEGQRHGRCFRHGNLFYNVAESDAGETLVRMVQWPSYHQDALNRVRLDARFARLLDPLIGPDLKQIINQVHWKAPGSLGDFAWHQDLRFRTPASAYRRPRRVLRPDRPRDRSAHAGLRLHALHPRQPCRAARSISIARRRCWAPR